MKLKADNIQEWKKEFDKQMQERAGVADYSTTLTDEEWLESYEDWTAEEAASEEISNFYE